MSQPPNRPPPRAAPLHRTAAPLAAHLETLDRVIDDTEETAPTAIPAAMELADLLDDFEAEAEPEPDPIVVVRRTPVPSAGPIRKFEHIPVAPPDVQGQEALPGWVAFVGTALITIFAVAVASALI